MQISFKISDKNERIWRYLHVVLENKENHIIYKFSASKNNKLDY